MSAAAAIPIRTPDAIWLDPGERIRWQKAVIADAELASGAQLQAWALTVHCLKSHRWRITPVELGAECGQKRSAAYENNAQLADRGYIRLTADGFMEIIPIGLRDAERPVENSPEPVGVSPEKRTVRPEIRTTNNKERAFSKEKFKRQNSTASVIRDCVGKPLKPIAAEQIREKRESVWASLQWLDVTNAETLVRKADMTVLLRMEYAETRTRQAVIRASRHRPIENPGGLFMDFLNSPWCHKAAQKALAELSPPPDQSPPLNPEVVRLTTGFEAHCANNRVPKTAEQFNLFLQLDRERKLCDDRRNARSTLKSSASLIEGRFGE